MTNTITSGNTSAFEARGSVQCTLNADHTLFWNNTSGISGTNYLDGDPDFIDPPAGDYHIGPSSAAINQGIDAGVTDDIDGGRRPIGSAPDIGADERPGYLVYSPSVTKQYR